MPKAPPLAATLSLSQATSCWVRHQGLGGGPEGDLERTVVRTGWIRTLGGADGYLSLLARVPDVTVSAVHAAVGARRLRIQPAARGCIYLVPAEHAPLALSLAWDLVGRKEQRTWERAGIADGELDAVGAAVLDVLAQGPRGTTGLRRALPDEAVRSLGAAGKKVGVSSTLPPALRWLEFQGRIVRHPLDDRLDHERYDWMLAPEGEPQLDPRPASDRHADLMRLLLRWFAPVTRDDLAEFSGLGKRDTSAALAAADAAPVAVEGRDGLHWMLEEQLGHAEEPAPPAPRLLPALDTLLVWRGGPAPFVHPDDLDRTIPVWGRQAGDTWATVKHPMARVVMAEAQVRGRWEYDPDDEVVVVGPYAPGLSEGTQEEAERVAALLRALGHGRPFSLAKDDDLRARCAQVRALG